LDPAFGVLEKSPLSRSPRRLKPARYTDVEMKPVLGFIEI
jgi:hypothetical protein